MKNPFYYLIGGVSLLTVALLISGCSSVPYSKGYKKFSSATSDTHDYVRDLQDTLHDGEFANTRDLSKTFLKKYRYDNCYKIDGMVSQWGILEPQVMFFGRGVFGQRETAIVYAPAQYAENDEYPFMEDFPGGKVFRIDAGAPHASHVILLMKEALHNANLCVQLHRVPDEEDYYKSRALLSARLLPTNEAKPPRSRTKAKRAEAHQKAPTQTQKKDGAKPQATSGT